MIEAVAREHARGRRLLIATTNLDSQKATIWDMGAIATRGGEEALRLFRDVLVASATLPGLFPPKLIDVEAPDGEGGMARYQEMHADGGIAAPLFLMPDALLRWRELGQRLRRGRVYVIFNTVLDPSPRTTPPGVTSIMGRSFETMLRFSYRQALSVAAGFCARHNLPLWSASIPTSFENFNMMKFETAVMKQTFDDAEALAISGRLWSSAIPTPEPLWRGLFKRRRRRGGGRSRIPSWRPADPWTRLDKGPPWSTWKSLFLEVAGAQLVDVRRIGAEVRGQAQAGVAGRAAHRVLVGQFGRRIEARAARLALEVAGGRRRRRRLGRRDHDALVAGRPLDALQRRRTARRGDAALQAQDLAARRLAIAHGARWLA
jgi:hypothetical protein